MKYRIHEIPRAVTSKWPARTIGSVGARRKTKNEDSGTGIAEARNRAGPVSLVAIGPAFRFADALAVTAKARTALTGDDGFMDLKQGDRKRFASIPCHCIP
jgi:hypothetical protein